MPGQENGSGFGSSPDECLNMQMMRTTAGCIMMVRGHLRKRKRDEEPSAWMYLECCTLQKGRKNGVLLSECSAFTAFVVGSITLLANWLRRLALIPKMSGPLPLCVPSQLLAWLFSVHTGHEYGGVIYKYD
jgi:hypothetical protein